jgi:hypothetical protein
LKSLSDNKQQKKPDESDAFVLTPSPNFVPPSLHHFQLPPDPFPLATDYLREFLSLTHSGKIDALTIIGMGPGDLVATMRIAVRKALHPDAAVLKLLLSRDALIDRIEDLRAPFKAR